MHEARGDLRFDDAMTELCAYALALDGEHARLRSLLERRAAQRSSPRVRAALERAADEITSEAGVLRKLIEALHAYRVSRQ